MSEVLTDLQRILTRRIAPPAKSQFHCNKWTTHTYTHWETLIDSTLLCDFLFDMRLNRLTWSRNKRIFCSNYRITRKYVMHTALYWLTCYIIILLSHSLVNDIRYDFIGTCNHSRTHRHTWRSVRATWNADTTQRSKDVYSFWNERSWNSKMNKDVHSAYMRARTLSLAKSDAMCTPKSVIWSENKITNMEKKVMILSILNCYWIVWTTISAHTQIPLSPLVCTPPRQARYS